jgi:hypothetical protein
VLADEEMMPQVVEVYDRIRRRCAPKPTIRERLNSFTEGWKIVRSSNAAP